MNSFSIESLVRANIRALKPYQSARDEFQGEAAVWLDANENPFDTNSGKNRYPDARHLELRKQAAEYFNVSADQVFAGHGSDEVIDLIFRVFCIPGESSVLIPQPSYGMYEVSAAIHDVRVVPVPPTDNLSINADSILQKVEPSSRILFLCSPNNPTGQRLPETEMHTLLKSFPGLVVIDEAYAEFSDKENWITQLNAYPNLIVSRTMSKAWGLAAIRIGFAIASPSIIAYLNRVKPPYNLSTSSIQDALYAFRNKKAKVQEEVRVIVEERERLITELSDLPVVKKVYPSDANFLLVQVTQADELYSELVKNGVVVRNRSTAPGCQGCLRITVGTPKENSTLIQILRRA